uniref:Uncharacterized protein n=1 Tax=Ciona intestinalis TaxID=7719 RepID=H2Y091_CIOIN
MDLTGIQQANTPIFARITLLQDNPHWKSAIQILCLACVCIFDDNPRDMFWTV